MSLFGHDVRFTSTEQQQLATLWAEYEKANPSAPAPIATIAPAPVPPVSSPAPVSPEKQSVLDQIAALKAKYGV